MLCKLIGTIVVLKKLLKREFMFMKGLMIFCLRILSPIFFSFVLVDAGACTPMHKAHIHSQSSGRSGLHSINWDRNLEKAYLQISVTNMTHSWVLLTCCRNRPIVSSSQAGQWLKYVYPGYFLLVRVFCQTLLLRGKEQWPLIVTYSVNWSVTTKSNKRRHTSKTPWCVTQDPLGRKVDLKLHIFTLVCKKKSLFF